MIPQTWIEEYLWFGLAWFYDLLIIVGHLMLYLFSNIYIKYIGFSFVWFYGLSTIISNLIANFLYLYIKYIGFGLVFFGLMSYQPLYVI